MKHRIVSGLVLVPLMIVLSTTPAYAIFGSIIAAIQRAQMIVNQGVQIYNDAMEKITMNGQLTELTDQFSHLKEQALGTVGALMLAIIGKRIFLDFRRPATGHANLVSGVGSAEMDRSSG